MEHHLKLYRWSPTGLDWPAAIVAGLVGGATLMVMELLWLATSATDSPWAISDMIAAIVLGPDVLHAAGFDWRIAATALITHYALGILFALVLAALFLALHLHENPSLMLLAGAVFGALLYGFNFYVMVRAFPWFAELRSGTAFIAHIIFGMVTGAMYLYLQQHSRLRSIA
ncbi:hypothetical protein SAMN06265795_10370 [Noviherbaspirillum humi]|uniref:Sodium:proline symporter n=1 Tax=Noviherbaspirillum humi TaxID=1688639 RepID=A0A239EY77_9BURK|nr:hypothetical protein [Noviherbaspirillum humi]SNS49401.1 hypothetical protein SAMN06265795_10370 [Noviherbaspirillum humi]